MTTIAGVPIPTRALVYGLISSAHRDETRFDDPERLDLGREKNRHLAFGHGIHYRARHVVNGWMRARSLYCGCQASQAT